MSKILTTDIAGKRERIAMARRPSRKNSVEKTERAPEFDDHVLEHMEMLYAVAMKLTRNSSDAQDLTQNTILKALRFHAKFEQGTYMKAWLLTILRNTFINEYRRKVRHPTFVELTGAEPAAPTTPDPDIVFEPRGNSYHDIVELLDDEVTNAIDNLPDDFRLAVIMADVEGKSYKEIAAVMGCPIGTVMSRLYRGRKILRQKLHTYVKGNPLVPRGTRM